MAVVGIVALFFLSLGSRPALGQSGDMFAESTDAAGDVMSADGVTLELDNLDISLVNASFSLSTGTITGVVVRVEFVDAPVFAAGYQYAVRVGNRTAIIEGNTTLGDASATVSDNSIRVTFNNVTAPQTQFNTAVFVNAMYLSPSGTAYFDTVLIIEEDEGPEVVVKEKVKRVYPDPWNIFGVTAAITFSSLLFIEGLGVTFLASRKERRTGLAMLAASLTALAAITYVLFFSAQKTLLGMFQWDEVPILQTTVTLISGLIGALAAVIILLAYIVRVQSR